MVILQHTLVAMVFGLFRTEKTTNNLPFLFFARVGEKIRKGIPRYLRGFRKMLFNEIEITFSIHGNEWMIVTLLNFSMFSHSLVSFSPFLLSLLIFLIYLLLYGVFSISVTSSWFFLFCLHVVVLLYVPMMIFCIIYIE